MRDVARKGGLGQLAPHHALGELEHQAAHFPDRVAGQHAGQRQYQHVNYRRVMRDRRQVGIAEGSAPDRGVAQRRKAGRGEEGLAAVAQRAAGDQHEIERHQRPVIALHQHDDERKEQRVRRGGDVFQPALVKARPVDRVPGGRAVEAPGQHGPERAHVQPVFHHAQRVVVEKFVQEEDGEKGQADAVDLPLPRSFFLRKEREKFFFCHKARPPPGQTPAGSRWSLFFSVFQPEILRIRKPDP